MAEHTRVATGKYRIVRFNGRPGVYGPEKYFWEIEYVSYDELPNTDPIPRAPITFFGYVLFRRPDIIPIDNKLRFWGNVAPIKFFNTVDGAKDDLTNWATNHARRRAVVDFEHIEEGTLDALRGVAFK